LLKLTGNVAYSAAVRLSSVLEVVLLLEEEEERINQPRHAIRAVHHTNKELIKVKPGLPPVSF